MQAYNTIPQIEDNTNAMHRRILFIKFEQKFTEAARWVDEMWTDPKELSGALNLRKSHDIRYSKVYRYVFTSCLIPFTQG